MRKLEIIGGGLSGLGLANGLLKNNVPVTVIESGIYPRHRVCGEFLTGIKQETLDILGIPDCLDRALIHKTTGWYRSNKKIAGYNLPEMAHGISRYALDNNMAQAFQGNGGELIQGTFGSVEPMDGRILAAGRKPGRSGMIGLKAHWSDLATMEDLELHLGNHAYLGISRVEDGYVNVCGIFKRIASGKFASPIERFLETMEMHGLGYLCKRLESATYRPNSFCSVTGLDYKAATAAGIGDQRSLIPPFTGNGMTIALESARTVLPHALDYASEIISWSEFLFKSHTALRNRFKRRYFHARIVHPFILNPGGQNIAAALAGLNLLPFRIFYELTHS